MKFYSSSSSSFTSSRLPSPGIGYCWLIGCNYAMAIGKVKGRPKGRDTSSLAPEMALDYTPALVGLG